jgi:hypothetical protein
VIAALVYPGTWFTVDEPAELACRYFDPEPITVPDDPATLETAVMASLDSTAYADAVTAAIDPANWTVAQSGSTTGENSVPITCVAAVSAAEASGLPVGTARFACLAGVGSAGTVTIWATGTEEDDTFQADAAVVSLMTLVSTFTPAP